jgi:hypothetical protein
VGADGFRVIPVVSYRNGFLPVAVGSVSGVGPGTRVEVRLRPYLLAGAFMSVWLAFGVIFLVVAAVAAIREPRSGWLVPFGLFVVGCGYGLTIGAFTFEARRVRRNLALLVGGTDPADLPRRDLSWLRDIRVRRGEPVDRRFNRAFLAVYVLAGAAALLAWFRTVSACTSTQLDSGDYVCPSGSRIGSTWLLAVVPIAAGFVSRLVIHKRARWAYVPLLALVALCGLVSFWLATHHERWGVPR